MILGIYKITSYSGSSKMTRLMNLISHNDYLTKIKPREVEICRLETDNSISKERRESKIKTIKAEIVNMFGNSYFTDRSPLYLNRHTGRMKLDFVKERDVCIKYELLKV